MTTSGAVCTQCGAAYARLDPVMFSVQGVLLAGREFCSEPCASSWARAAVTSTEAELARVRGWLRGYGGNLASIALNSPWTAADYAGGRKDSDVSVPHPAQRRRR